ncbi:MAG: sensor histidine kinase [Eubacterium sp.]|nr:sensor histidine kinase [Eubacterium sp.]
MELLASILDIDKMMFLRYVLEGAGLVTACVCVLLPARKNLIFSTGKTWALGLILSGALVVVGSYLCLLQGWTTNYFFLPGSVILSVVYFIVTDLSVTKKLFCLFNAAMLIGFSTFYTTILTAPWEEHNTDPVFTWQVGVIALSFGWVITAFFSRTLAVKLPMLMQSRQLSGIWGLLMFIPLILMGLFYTGSTAGGESYVADDARPTMLGITLIIPVAVWLIYHLLWGTATRIAENARLKNENMLLRMEQKRYFELRTFIGDTRTMRHDYRQHVRVLMNLAEEGKSEEIKEYLKNFTNESANATTFFSGNDTLDAILSHYDHKAKEQETAVTWKIELPQKLPVNEMEFCSMVGNLIENALNATAKLPPEQRKIRVISEMVSESMIGLSMDNTFAGKLRMDKNGFPRAARAGHGIGLQSVANTVRRNNGTIEFQVHENVFSVNILMQGKPEKAAGKS